MMISGREIPPSCNWVIDSGISNEENVELSILEADENHENINDEQNQANESGKPPRTLPVMRHCISQTILAATSDLEMLGLKSPPDEQSSYLPILRSGSCSEIGPKQYMEDEYICVDDLHQHLAEAKEFPYPAAFYGVFDGHGGIDAASFAKKNLLTNIVEDPHFPTGVKRAIRNAFVKTDHALADTKTLDNSSGTTAITTLVLGRYEYKTYPTTIIL
ncbi:protein phosphatase [Lithospermum erythrorhizon]|uniref:protein-serine/threonine phosphatase n=1 Tax=Lithospermum erythrorhizon TaxID=34254 RepID=A0AAV3RCS2_LITER